MARRSHMQITGVYGAGEVFLRPAAEGTGVIAGGAVRAVLELAGVSDVLSKCIGSRTPINMVHATVAASERTEDDREALANCVRRSLQEIR